MKKKKKPVLIGEVIEADCLELRELSKYFEERGKPENAKFLRDVATRHEVIFGAYWTARREKPEVYKYFMDDIDGKALADAGF